MQKKPCPQSVKAAGAALLKARRAAADLTELVIAARAAVKATLPEMVKAGAKEMQAGTALDRLMDAARAEGLIGQAHDSLRAVLGDLGFAEPTNAELVAMIESEVTTFGLGGGGGSGR